MGSSSVAGRLIMWVFGFYSCLARLRPYVQLHKSMDLPLDVGRYGSTTGWVQVSGWIPSIPTGFVVPDSVPHRVIYAFFFPRGYGQLEIRLPRARPKSTYPLMPTLTTTDNGLLPLHR